MAQIDYITMQTGQTPAIMGDIFSIYGNVPPNVNGIPGAVVLANDWIAKGGIVFGMFSPGDPCLSSVIIGGQTIGPSCFTQILDPTSKEHGYWNAGLDQLAQQLKSINGPMLLRLFPEMNRDEWWGSMTAGNEIQNADLFVKCGITP